VLSFQKPVYHAQLRSFLGLANYFRDHVKHHSTIVGPLQSLLNNYDRRTKLNWTEETEAAWENIKQAIHSCPKLFFMDNTSEIHLYTDASNYGIGAYLCQMVNGKEVPIAFISKTLTPQQIEKWSTPQKEGYAIYYALCKLEHLLLDRPFIIHTDHKNLTYINDSVNAMVVRWKMYLQEYTFKIQFIKGLDNVVADNFSRLCILDESVRSDFTDEQILQLIEDDECFYDLSELNKVPNRPKKIIKKVHNSFVGHHGVEKTLQKLQSAGYQWTNMRQHVRTYIARCSCCQMMSQIAPTIRSNPYTLSRSKPMHSLAMDTLGPLPEDEKGNKYLIAIIDIFSRFLEIYPVVDTSAASAADALLQHAGRYGIPSLLTSDGGSQYVNEIISAFLELMGTEHHITLAYSKQENGIIERSNKEILRHLKAIIFESAIITRWGKDLPFVQRIINSTVHESIGVSPAQIIFGDAINLNRGLIVSVEDKEKFDSEVVMSEYSKDMIARQAEIIAAAQKHQHNVNEQYIATKNKKYKDVEITIFPVNSYVLLGYPSSSLKKGPPNKLMTDWQGPYKVIKYIGNDYTILNLATMKEETVNVKRLKEFLSDGDNDPQQVANQANQQFVVESIISHTGNPNYRGKMKFKVKWLGYEEPTIEPWSKQLSHLEVMHDYLRANKLKQMIPVAFK
jgi:transposase InsO family protein